MWIECWNKWCFALRCPFVNNQTYVHLSKLICIVSNLFIAVQISNHSIKSNTIDFGIHGMITFLVKSREAKRCSTSNVLLDFMPSNKFWYKFPTNFYIWSFDWVPFVRTHWLLLTKNDWNPHKHTYLLDNLRSLWFIVWHRQILISIPLLGCFFGLELANG